MKKNFFKKLSFVLALAMIVSVFAPAAGAFAATKTPKLNKSKVYLNLGVDGKDEFDFNVWNKNGYNNVDYVSADEDVAVVDEMGVTTATGIGRTTISVTLSNKKGVEYKNVLKATVVVRDNVADLTAVTGLPADKAVVGEEYDLDVTYKTDAGNTEGSSSYFAWEVLKDGKATEVATIDKDGKFVATEAGKYEVVARAFQTIDGFKLFDADREKNAKYVLDTVKAEVEVAVSITDVKLVTPKKLQITFDSSVKDVVKTVADVKVNLKLSETYSAMVPVWTFDSISDDGKVVTVSTYDNLVDKQNYTVAAAGATSPFYAQVGTPVSILMDDQTVPAGTATTVDYKLYDQYDVDVKASYDGVVTKNSNVPIVDGKITLTNGQVAFVEFNYTIFKEDGTSQVISTGLKKITGVAATATSAFEWNVHTSEDFTKTAKAVKANDFTQSIFGRAKKTDGDYTNAAIYKFVSLNESILMIDANGNKLVPISAGTALVKVVDTTNNDALVTYINVEVKAAPAAASIKASDVSIRLSNNITNVGQESKTVTIKFVDQYGDEHATTIQDSYVINAGRATDLATITPDAAAGTITFTANPGKAGIFNYYVKAADKTTMITVTVAAPGALYKYEIESTQAKIDNYVGDDRVSALSFSVYAIDAAGVKKEKVVYSVSGPSIDWSIKNGDGVAVVTGAAFNGTGSYSVDDTVSAAKPGMYSINVSIGGIPVTKNFEVVNTRPTPSLNVKALSANVTVGASINTVVNSLLELKYGNAAAAIKTGSVKFQTGNSAIISSADQATATFTGAGKVTVYITEIATDNNTGNVLQKVAVNKAFTITVTN